jgi:polyhydroxyalkanoate synthase
VVLRKPGVTLKGYGEPSRARPVILMVPAPIKRAYIWDLAPGASVVEQCVSGGAQPYLIQWEEPQAAFGLEDYGERLIRACIEAIGAETGEENLFLIGHSLGGVFAAIFASLHPSWLRGLVLLGSPLHFDFAREAGALGPVIATLSRSGLLGAMPDNLPGSCLSLVSFMASPTTFSRDRWVDWLRSLPDHEAVKTHLRVERWSLDELPLARQLVVDIEEQLYREGAFLRGKLALGSRTASAREVVTPLLVVADEHCAIVPPGAILPFVEAAGATDKSLLWYEGDIGAALQHIGMLIGRNAHRHLWPEVLRWMHAHRRPLSL